MSFKVNLLNTPVNYIAKAAIVGKDNIYTIDKARFANSTYQLVSENANTCVMLGLNGGKGNNCLMHLAPEQQPLGSLKVGIEKCIETIRGKMDNIQEEVTGILVGGRNSSNKDSFNLFNEVANILDDLGVPFSMLCGKFDNVANDNILISGEKVKIWNSSIKKDNIEDLYEVVEISDKVPVDIIV